MTSADPTRRHSRRTSPSPPRKVPLFSFEVPHLWVPFSACPGASLSRFERMRTWGPPPLVFTRPQLMINSPTTRFELRV